jgi:hypothetical protein
MVSERGDPPLVLRGGTVIDGTGAARFVADQIVLAAPEMLPKISQGHFLAPR